MEFLVAAPVVLLAGLAVVEAAHWHLVRQAVSVALMEAARVGSVAHAHPGRMEAAFQQALRPLTRGAPAWRIDVLSPDAAAFALHADHRLRIPGAAGHAAINHDHQALQHRQTPRTPDIFQANTLVLRLHYEHTPLTPLVAALLRTMGQPGGNAVKQARAAGRVPIIRQVALPMQSHPVQWSKRVDSALLQPPSPIGDHRSPAFPTGQTPGAPTWPPAPDDRPLDDSSDDARDAGTSGPPDAAPSLPPWRWPDGTNSQGADPWMAGDESLCGVALCCAGLNLAG